MDSDFIQGEGLTVLRLLHSFVYIIILSDIRGCCKMAIRRGNHGRIKMSALRASIYSR